MMNILHKISKFLQEKILPFIKDPLFLSRWVLPYYREDEPNRISVSLGSGGYRWVGHDYRGDISMFIQDMYQGIMPFTHIHREGPQFTARLDPGNRELENIVAEALKQEGYQPNLTEALCDFIQSTTHSLFTYGYVTYEIVYETDANGRITSFEFVYVLPLSIRKIFDDYYQVIPWRVAKHSHVKVGIRKIPTQRLLYIEFPKELGGRRNLRNILKRLSVLGKEIIPNFQMETMKNGQNIGFDLKQYVREKYLEKAQLTKCLGWNQRKIPDDEILEYYSIYRHLHFALSQAIIRERILESVNNVLNGKILNLGVKIVMEGVPTSHQIKAEFKALRTGDLEFVKLFKRTII